jgi:hypothetical protein
MELARLARAHGLAGAQPTSAQAGRHAVSRRQFFRTAGAVVLGATAGAALWRPPAVAAAGDGSPVHIPGGTPVLGGAFHLFGPGLIDPANAEPASITDFNGFLGLAYISGTVTQTNTVTGEVRTLPYLESDMRFMKGTYRGTDGQIHKGTFGFV